MTLKKLGAIALLSMGISAAAYAESCQDTALYKDMRTLAQNMRPMTQAIRSNDMDTARELLPAMKAAAESASQEMPYLFRDGAADSDVAAYEAVMADFTAEFAALETALASGDQGAAARAMQALGDVRRTGHGDFKDSSCED